MGTKKASTKKRPVKTKKNKKKSKKKIGRRTPGPQPDPTPPRRRKKPPSLKRIPWHRRKRRPHKRSPVTTIMRPGNEGAYFRIVVVGDGFGKDDQNVFNQRVDNLVLQGVFGNDVFWEDGHAFQVDRLNLISNESPASTRTYDADGITVINEQIRDTFFGFVYNGVWSRCWFDSSPDSYARLNEVLDYHTPGWQRVIVILNTPGFGGCAGGKVIRVTMAGNWYVTGHEMGHAFGLADEYCARADAWTGTIEPTQPNVTLNTDMNTLKWKHFINPATPIPTGLGACAGYTEGIRPADWSNSDDAGLFEGGRTYPQGIYRPVINCRMRGNSPPYCPVCKTGIREILGDYITRDFTRHGLGDFNGDGRDDLLIHTGRSIQVYRSDGMKLDMVFHALYPIHEYWDIRRADKFWIADFNGDGKDEVLVYNSYAGGTLALLVDDGNNGLHAVWYKGQYIGQWDLRQSDEFIIGDYNGDGSKDLAIVNRSAYLSVHFVLFRSGGDSFALQRVFEGSLPDWSLSTGDQFLFVDIDGDGAEELIVYNGADWAVPYLGIFKWQNNDLVQLARYEGDIGGWQMGSNDNFMAADFDGDGNTDLYVVRHDAAGSFLGMLKSTGTGFGLVMEYVTNVGGWELSNSDQFTVSDVSGTGQQGLVVLNTIDWGSAYLGRLVSDGVSLTATQSVSPIGDWDIAPQDKIKACNIVGGVGQPNLMIYRQDRLGFFALNPDVSPMLHYFKWIHNYKYGRNPDA